MKYLLLIIVLLVLNVTLSAQDTVRKLQIPVNRITSKKAISIQQSITNQINAALDSLIISTKGKELFVNNVISSIEVILYSYWKNGKLTGTKSSNAYFVKCSPQTMTQAQIENGFLVVSVGIACNKPAEFELLRFERVIPGKKIVINQ